ncbi:MAG: siroheme synthase CysG [Pseudomonadales bacterium]|nr:siroheme synthase CysG [Pseudomonadales bacterium]
MDQLPVYLSLQGSPCLVIGGGSVAERKVNLLLKAGACVTVVSPELNKSLGALLVAGSIVHLREEFRVSARDENEKLLRGKRLVVVAIDDSSQSKLIAEIVNATGVLCNVVDDLAASSFIFPAIVDRSPVLIAIGTGGNAPVLAQRLKAQIERMLPAGIAALAAQAGKWRTLVKQRFPTMRERRKFWQQFFEGSIGAHLLANRVQKAEQEVRKILVHSIKIDAGEAGEAYIVGAGPGDPGLVTLRAQQLISSADVVMYDRLVSREVLDFARKDANLVCVGKQPGKSSHSQDEINALLIDYVKQGDRVCRLKGGDPFIFGRGGEEALALAEAGLSYQIVPGVSAALGCGAYSGIPLTYRGMSQSVTFATARLDEDGDQALDWQALARSGQTLVLYMGVAGVSETSRQLIANGMSTETPVAMIENGTTTQQRTIYSTLSSIQKDAAQASIQAPAIMIIGDTVKLGAKLAWYGDDTATDYLAQEILPWHTGIDELDSSTAAR